MAITNFGPGTFVWTDGAPTHNPDDGAKFAIDVNTYVQYEWVSGTTWAVSPISVKKISGTSAPSGAPGLHDSQLAINEVPELYYYFSGSWHLVSGGGGTSYTAGDGIDITGTVISNTGVLTSTNAGGDLSGTFLNLQIVANAVGTTEIAEDAVTQAKIAAGAVGSSELQSTAVTAGTYGSATQVGQFTVDADGRLTAASNVAITGDNWGTQVVEHGTTLSGNGTVGSPLNVATDGITANEIAPGAVGSSELASTAVTPGSYTLAGITVDSDGRITAAASGTALTEVTTDATLTGDGSGGSPLGVSFPILAPDGSSTAPSYSFSNAVSTGVFHDGTTVWLSGEEGKQAGIQTANAGEPGDIIIDAGDGSLGGDISITTGAGSSNRGGNMSITLGAGVDANGGALTVTSGSSNQTGGSITMTSGDGFNTGGEFILSSGDATENTGGNFTMNAGASTNGGGGAFTMLAGDGVSGGAFYVEAGAATGADQQGGQFAMLAGDSPNGFGGVFEMQAGDGGEEGGSFSMRAGNGVFGGSFSMQAGNATADEESAGSFFILGGDSSGEDASGGNLNMRGGFGTSATATGGVVNVLGGQAVFRGGTVNVVGGQTTAGSLKGGDVSIGGGSGPGGRGLVSIDASMFRLATFATTQRDALTSVPAGTMIFNTTTSKFQGYTGSAWVDFH